jgi:hypothetical protein
MSRIISELCNYDQDFSLPQRRKERKGWKIVRIKVFEKVDFPSPLVGEGQGEGENGVFKFL